MCEKLQYKTTQYMNTYRSSNCLTISPASGLLLKSSSVHELNSSMTGWYSSPSGLSGNGGLVPGNNISDMKQTTHPYHRILSQAGH